MRNGLGLGLNLSFSHRSGGSSFDPVTIPGTIGYWDAKRSLMTTREVGGVTYVSEWKSLHAPSDAPSVFAQGIDSKQPILLSEGALRTDGNATATKREMALSANKTAKTVIILARQTFFHSLPQYVIGNIGTPHGIQLASNYVGGGIDNNLFVLIGATLPLKTVTKNDQFVVNKKSIATLVFDGTSSVIKINGVSKNVVDTAGTTGITINRVFGARDGGFINHTFYGEIFAVYLNSDVLSAQQITDIENYLIALHGIEV